VFRGKSVRDRHALLRAASASQSRRGARVTLGRSRPLTLRRRERSIVARTVDVFLVIDGQLAMLPCSSAAMPFEVLGEIDAPLTIARGRGIRRLRHLLRRYGGTGWRKRGGIATVLLASGRVRRAEAHWYEAHGIGRVELKIKRFVD
jgi:hypothetical protein